MSISLSVSGLRVWSASDPNQPLVRDASFDIELGGSLTLLGESGSGKSLLAHAIMGTLPAGLAADGWVALGDERTRASDARARHAWWGRRLALLPQEPWLALDPTMRAQDQVAETHRFVRGATRSEARALALDDLARLDLGHAAAKFPFMLSGGMAQRVAFAATCAGGAPVLIVDEPTKGLDDVLRDQVVALLRGVLERGGAVLAITHDVAVARMLGGAVAVMREAEVVEQGAASEVLERPRHAYTRRLLAAEPSAWADRPRRPAPDAPVLLHARDVSKRFGDRELFAQVDLTIRAGDRIAVTGPSGAGKTTLGNVLLGLAKPDSGAVERSTRLGRHAFQKLYQDPVAAFPPRVTLRRALDDLLRLHGLHWAQAESLLSRLRLSPALLERLPSQVSGGELQRLALLRVLLLKPALVFADEPTSRLDPVTQQETFALLLDALEEEGSALVLVTHDRELARKVGRRVVAVEPGQGISRPVEESSAARLAG